jgi:hypothetical protein
MRYARKIPIHATGVGRISASDTLLSMPSSTFDRLKNQEITLKSTLRPLHLRDDEWTNMLDELHDARSFENNLESCYQALLCSGKNISESAPSPAPSYSKLLIDGNCLIAPGDGHVWPERVEEWIDEPHVLDVSGNSGCMSDTETRWKMKHRAHLVKALMGHGILQERDLCILSEGGLGWQSSQSERVSTQHQNQSTKSACSASGEIPDPSVNNEASALQPQGNSGGMRLQMRPRAVQESRASPRSTTSSKAARTDLLARPRTESPECTSKWEQFLHHIDSRIFSL